MRENNAGFQGGAMHLDGGVTLNITDHPTAINGQWLGEPAAAFYLTNNTVNQEGGGGIFAVKSALNLRHIQFSQNNGSQLGGAIALLESSLVVDAQNQEGCEFYPLGCNIFSTNEAEFGGAIWANVDSDITIRKT
jgi:predicted outer membrane repeat protein